MTAFFDLFVSHSNPEGWADPTGPDRRFPELVAASPFHLWRPGDPIAERDLRYLIGVATWSGYDMHLLDVMAEALSHNPIAPPVVEVFNTADCQQPQDFARYMNGLGDVSQTPVVGFWNNGELIWSGQGSNARELLAGIFNLHSSEIVGFVQDWIKARAHA